MEFLKRWYNKIHEKNSLARKIAGIVLIALGLLALVTPFTPGSWLIFVGLEFFGIRMAIWDRIKSKFIQSQNLNEQPPSGKRYAIIVLVVAAVLALAWVAFVTIVCEDDWCYIFPWQHAKSR